MTHPPDLDMKDSYVDKPLPDPLVYAAPLAPEDPLGICAPQHPGDVGWDLVAAMDVPIGPMDSADIPVNLRLQLPDGIYVDIRNRSSMARRNLYVDQNLVDTGYRGGMFVFIRNMNLPAMRAVTDAEVQAVQNHGLVLPGAAAKPYAGPNVLRAPVDLDQGTVVIRAGERIAQLVFCRHTPVKVEAVLSIATDTGRGEGGFGSTGS